MPLTIKTMNQKGYIKENYLMSFIDFARLSNSRENMFPLTLNNESKEHKALKFKIAMELVEKGHKVFVEAILKGNLGRPDIISISPKGEGFIWEIVNSESQESINLKLNKYPIDFDVQFIKINEPLEVII